MRATHGISAWSAGFEGYGDFDLLYVPQLVQMAHGAIPYRDFAVSYPPLFLYTLYPFYILGGASFASVPIILADAATPVLLYLLVERHAGQKLALLAALAYAFSPSALFYEGYIWYSSQPFTFFALLATYYFFRDKPVFSFSVLAIALLFKQEAIFLLPVFVAWFVRRDARRFAIGFTAFIAIIAAVSLPFLIVSAQGYLSLVSYGLLGRWPGLISPTPVTSAICQNLYTNLAGTARLCTLGSITNSQFVANMLPTTVLIDQLSHDADVLSSIIVVPMLLLVIPVLFSLRKHEQCVALILTYSGIVFLILFSLVFHQVFKYYYIPVYSLLLTCAVDKKTIAVAAAAWALSLVSFSGAFQELLPLLAILVIAVILDNPPGVVVKARVVVGSGS